ncbi:MAG: hypothetical protein ABIZ49_10635 [Opitutaceae bacterium]
MKAVLICPSDRPGVARLADLWPLAIAPLLGKSVLVYWIETLAARGVKHFLVLANDRPHLIRAAIGSGARWGVRLDVLPQSREPTVEEARSKYFPAGTTEGRPDNEVALLDYLPGQPHLPLFETYAGWFAAVKAWIPYALTPTRIGAREVQPAVFVGLHSQISPDAQLVPPCWIGENVSVGPNVMIGPDAIVDDNVVVERGARIVRSVVTPETFVGQHMALDHSLAAGGTLIDWQNGSCLRVPDAFLLGPLSSRRSGRSHSSLPARVLAVAAMAATAPIALVAIVISLARGEAPLRLRLGVRPRDNVRERGSETFAYYELASAGNWLRRWPQFWSVARGDLTWIGNRPLRPTQAFSLTSDFERLWLVPSPGLISLADSCGCPEGIGAEACAHASFYATNANRRLDARIAARALFRAALAWPLYWTRRREQTAALSPLAQKPQSGA